MVNSYEPREAPSTRERQRRMLDCEEAARRREMEQAKSVEQ